MRDELKSACPVCGEIPMAGCAPCRANLAGIRTTTVYRNLKDIGRILERTTRESAT